MRGPRGRAAPWHWGEQMCLWTGLASLPASAFFLFSSFSSDNRGVGPSLEEPSLQGGWNCLGFPLVIPSERDGYSPGCSPHLWAQPISPNTRQPRATPASLMPYLLYLRSLSSHRGFIYNCVYNLLGTHIHPFLYIHLVCYILYIKNVILYIHTQYTRIHSLKKCLPL